MIIGHAGIALLAKRARPRVSLAVLVVAAYGCDIVEMFFRAFHNYNRELSHSLVSVGILASVMSLTYLLATRRPVDAAAVWVTYVLHWPADFITGMKPTWPGGPEVGLMLYDRPFVEFLLEVVFVAFCVWIYFRPRPAVTEPVT